MRRRVAPGRLQVVVLCALSWACGCSGDVRYEALPDQTLTYDEIESMLGAASGPVVAARGSLLCRFTLSDSSSWDTSWLPFSGAEYADVVASLRFEGRAAQTSQSDAHQGLHGVVVPGVEVEPGASFEVDLTDLDDTFHDHIDTHTLTFSGSWPLRSERANSTVVCMLTTPEALEKHEDEKFAAYEKALAEAEASFDPQNPERAYGFSTGSMRGVLQQAARHDAQPRMRELARAAEQRWGERARARTAEIVAALPPMGTAVSPGDGLEAIAFPVECGPSATSRLSDLLGDPQKARDVDAKCVVKVVLRNTADEPMTLTFDLSENQHGEPLTATRAGAPVRLDLEAFDPAGFEAAVYIVAEGEPDAQGRAPRTFPKTIERVVEKDGLVTLHVATHAYSMECCTLGDDTSIAYMGVKGGERWRVAP